MSPDGGQPIDHRAGTSALHAYEGGASFLPRPHGLEARSRPLRLLRPARANYEGDSAWTSRVPDSLPRGTLPATVGGSATLSR